MLSLPIPLLFLAVSPPDATRIDVPGQPVHVAITIPGYRPDELPPDPERVLTSGQTEAGCVVSVLYEENLPYLSSRDAAARYATGKRVQNFLVRDVACCEFKTEVRDTIVETTFQAFPATAEYLFDIHVSFVVAKEDVGKPGNFSRSDFIEIVKSFAIEGKPDIANLAFPPEVYAFRDEAAKAEGDAYAWLTKQCVMRGGDWVPNLYLGMVAESNDRASYVVQGYTRAIDLLEDVKDRTPKQTRALLIALERLAHVHSSEKRFDKALPCCDKTVRFVRPEDPPEIQRFREEALFLLACCYAKAGQKDAAMTALEQAIRLRPDFRDRALESDLLESLKSLEAFQRLVGDPRAKPPN